ncbi:hypothetical protein BpHYR1_029626 [Brachionus plicatilis]|uniref:Uncharacterized protein n=1 Tax=Brachionus plicatilis TaxID=10195 RepID=A0A3M7RCP9_BRAPC|nr:hypothetical protein BpHYR1_029626 [Brachionus plicatilis]
MYSTKGKTTVLARNGFQSICNMSKFIQANYLLSFFIFNWVMKRRILTFGNVQSFLQSRYLIKYHFSNLIRTFLNASKNYLICLYRLDQINLHLELHFISFILLHFLVFRSLNESPQSTNLFSVD